jgi:uncharacterized tellurite resistance protein B-like protein
MKGFDSMKKLAQKREEMVDALKEKGDIARRVVDNTLKKKEDAPLTAAEGTLKILYYLMAVDGKIETGEEEKFNFIGVNTDPEFEAHKQKLLRECQTRMKSLRESGDSYRGICESICEIIGTLQDSKEETLHGKLLIWNMLATSYSDGDCAPIEKKLIHYVSNAVRVEKTVLLEMESTMQTMMALDKEEQWLKSSQRAFTTVNPELDELTVRRQAIMDGVHALIAD